MVLIEFRNQFCGKKKIRLGSRMDKNKVITIVMKQSIRKDLYWFMVKHYRQNKCNTLGIRIVSRTGRTTRKKRNG